MVIAVMAIITEENDIIASPNIDPTTHKQNKEILNKLIRIIPEINGEIDPGSE